MTASPSNWPENYTRRAVKPHTTSRLPPLPPSALRVLPEPPVHHHDAPRVDHVLLPPPLERGLPQGDHDSAAVHELLPLADVRGPPREEDLEHAPEEQAVPRGHDASLREERRVEDVAAELPQADDPVRLHVLVPPVVPRVDQAGERPLRQAGYAVVAPRRVRRPPGGEYRERVGVLGYLLQAREEEYPVASARPGRAALDG
ncbi:hypothetical protein THAOC_03942, partial [Thalassiosira oceanica]